MQLFVPLAVVLSREPFSAARPRAKVRLLLVMRTDMAFQVEAPSKGASTTRDGARKVRRLFSTLVAGIGCPSSGDVWLRDVSYRERIVGIKHIVDLPHVGLTYDRNVGELVIATPRADMGRWIWAWSS